MTFRLLTNPPAQQLKAVPDFPWHSTGEFSMESQSDQTTVPACMQDTFAIYQRDTFWLQLQGCLVIAHLHYAFAFT